MLFNIFSFRESCRNLFNMNIEIRILLLADKSVKRIFYEKYSKSHENGLMLYYQGISVIHFFAEQLSCGLNYNKIFRLCTFLNISENFMKKLGLCQKI